MRSSARWTCLPAADPRRHRLGLSLLELLVAIAIVAAIAAVALPWTWNRLNRATLPETADRIAAVLLLARAEAMRSGRLVEVRVEPIGDAGDFGNPGDLVDLGRPGFERTRLRARYFDPDTLEPTPFLEDSIEGDLASVLEPTMGEDASMEAFGVGDGNGENRPAMDLIAGSWAVLELSEDLRLRPDLGRPREEFVGDAGSRAAGEPPAIDPTFADLADLAAEFDPMQADAESEPMAARPMAIFLPDGSNVLAGSWWLEERPAGDDLPPPELDRRRRVRLDFDDAAGLPRRGEIERIVPTAVGGVP